MTSEYVKYVVNERAKEVMEDLDQACRYARDVIKGRWCQAELTIVKDPWYASWYAREVINGQIGRAHV